MAKTSLALTGVIGKRDPFMEAVYGITEEIIDLADIKQFFADNPAGQVDITVNSRGGDAQMGLDIHDFLVNSGRTVTVTVEGVCYSAATAILLAAKKDGRIMNENSSIGIHLPYIPPYTLYEAYTADELQALADQMRVLEDLYVNLYVKSTGTDETTIRDLMKQEKIMAGQDAIDIGFVSMVKETAVQSRFASLKAVAFIQPNFNNMNQKIIDAIAAISAKMDAFVSKHKAEITETTEAETTEAVTETETEAGPTAEQLQAENAQLKAQVDELTAKVNQAEQAAEAQAEMQAEFAEIKAHFETLKNTVSEFKPPQRTQQEINEGDFASKAEQAKAAMRENRQPRLGMPVKK